MSIGWKNGGERSNFKNSLKLVSKFYLNFYKWGLSLWSGKCWIVESSVLCYLQPISWAGRTLVIDSVGQPLCGYNPSRVNLIHMHGPVYRQTMALAYQLTVPLTCLMHRPSVPRYSSCNSTFNRTANECFEKFIHQVVSMNFSFWKMRFDRVCWRQDFETSSVIPAVAIHTKSLDLLVRAERLVACGDTREVD